MLADQDGDGNLTKAELVDMLAQMPSGIVCSALIVCQLGFACLLLGLEAHAYAQATHVI